ncbi:hypothetical protein BGZ60DRAFT_382807 [Tricladium varicosporioides]|nr:hypothetical protein BGZ60DRAFT_382807 [Hymenoscyphus varicosporioides]
MLQTRVEEKQCDSTTYPSRSKLSAQLSSHHSSSPVVQQNKRTFRHRSLFSAHFLFFAFLICCLPVCSASMYIKEQMVETPRDLPESERSSISRLAKSGVILVDQSPPPKLAQEWTLESIADGIERRQFEAASSSSHSSTKAIEKTVTTTVAATKTSSSGIVTAAATDSSTPLPNAFDSGFNSNITSSCSNFMTNMLSNSTFKSCLPLSLLLQNSVSFFQAERSLVRITQVLDATCAANVTTCSTVMAKYASNITADTACASDLSTQNPLIQQARLGLLAYKPLYAAGCLKNPVSKSYCFAEAITNASSPSDNYVYFLPLNISLPGGSLPTCSTCLQNTMAVFEASSADRTSALASDYVAAAMQVNVNCGPNFVNASLAAAQVNSAQPIAFTGNSIGLIALVITIASWLL